MIKSLSYKFANTLAKNEVIENEEFEIYRYGFETLIYFIVNISVALFIGIVFDRFIHTIVFLTCYCTLRQFTGGYHARNYTECTLTFAIIYLSTIFVANNINIDKYKYLLILLMIISVFIINKLAPLDNRNKPLNETEKKYYRNIAMRILSVIVTLSTLSIMLNVFVEYFIYSVFAIVCISILLIVGYCMKSA
jgi:accessory gene regulator B